MQVYRSLNNRYVLRDSVISLEVSDDMMSQLKPCWRPVGLTTTRHGEMTSPNITRRRRQTQLQQQHMSSLRSRQPLTTDEDCLPTSLSKHRSQSPPRQIKPGITSHHRASSSLSLLRRAQLESTDDRQRNYHSMPCRHQNQRDQQDRIEPDRQQRQDLVVADSLQRGDENSTVSAFSRTSTMRVGSGTVNSTSTASKGYFSDCESDESKSYHQRLSQQRRRHLSQRQPWSHHPAARFPADDRRERSGSTSSRSRHGVNGLHGGRSRRAKYQPRSLLGEGTRIVNNDGAESSGIDRQTGHADGQGSTWNERRCRSMTDFSVVDCSEPRSLAWNLRTPHGVLSLRSTRWTERSGDTVVDRSKLADSWRLSPNARWFTIPKLSRRLSCNHGRARTLPASFRPRSRSTGSAAAGEKVSLRPIGRGIETLECEHCYLAARAHLRWLSAKRPATNVDSTATNIKTTVCHDSQHLDRASRTERVRRLHDVTRRQRRPFHDFIKDSTTATASTKPGVVDRFVPSCVHCRGMHS